MIKNITLLLLFTLIISFGQSCTTATFGQHADSLFLVMDNISITYDLKRPAKRYYMPYVLEEISGLSYMDPGYILAVDDESGRVFQYDLSKEEVIHSIGFYKPGDYEGVELINNQLYVLKSDGDLFRFPFGSNKKVKAKKFENDLSSANDTEGLGYDPDSKELLIACKEEGTIGKKEIDGRAFYKVRIDKMSLNPNPAFIIGPKELEAFWEQNRTFDYEKKRIKFKPSAIATHPISGHYYILSSVGKMLVVVAKSGKILATYPISPRILGQPEGLCFSPSADLYISSEGEGDRGYILKFRMKKS
ncbi:SdiA-regulated domain-containing protein [Ekhidna sp. To15]|uniref:SdiA-regulated domain-containing protein n=1 Tax=Ekhidna sp. To15 TaxID=3395267 RepID=UPI003F5230A4